MERPIHLDGDRLSLVFCHDVDAAVEGVSGEDAGLCQLGIGRLEDTECSTPLQSLAEGPSSLHEEVLDLILITQQHHSPSTSSSS